MLILISPSKTLNFEKPITGLSTQPEFVKEASRLIKPLRKLKIDQLMELMDISPKLARLNQERYYLWQPEFPGKATARQAIFAFRGNVYTGLDADTLSPADIEAAQQQLRILSGLYGVLRPLDLIRPYRLEMGIDLEVGKCSNLYEFWQKKITSKIRLDLDQIGSNMVINLASVEYYKVIDPKKLKARIVTPEFREAKEGTYKMISFFAKEARGMMTRFILQNGINSEEQLHAFDSDGYCYNGRISIPGRPVFTRG